MTSGGQFGIGLKDLSELHQESGAEKLAELGGVQGLAERLRVSSTRGISSSEESERKSIFGENRVPEKPPKSYLAYIRDALEDFTIRLLCVCAIFQLIVAFAVHLEEDPLSWLEGVAILLTVIIVCNIQAVQDWSKERKFRKQNAVSNQMRIEVLRDGEKKEISRYDAVVGDIIYIGVGDVLEADGVLLQAADVEIDESALTGEPEDLKKDTENEPFIFSGTAVKGGSGVFLATAVGVNSMAGKITALVRGQSVAPAAPEKVKDNDTRADDVEKGNAKEDKDVEKGDGKENKEQGCCACLPCCAKKDDEEEEGADGDDGESTSVLRVKLDAMVGKIAYFAFGSAGIATAVMVIRYVFDYHINSESEWDWKKDPNRILSAVIQGIAIVVVAVPEGLPLAVTLSLSLSMRQMLKDNNLVKHMFATETMGSATTICSDKTGTLTANRMTVVRAFVGSRELVGEHSNDKTCGKMLLADKAVSQQLKTLLCENICVTKADGADISWNAAADRWDQKGNKTDCAMLAFSDDLGVKAAELRARPIFQVPPKPGSSAGASFGLKMYTFSSSRKRSGHALPITERPDGACRLHVKGASEIILALCDEELHSDGTRRPLNDRRRKEIHKDVVDKFASQAMRTIAVAYREFEAPPDWDEEVSPERSRELTGLNAKTFKAETNLVFLGVLGIHDPIREGVPRAIKQCNGAGVDVRMVTGDHKATAIAIAKECGILRRHIDFKDVPGEALIHQYTVMTGDEFRRKVMSKDGRLNSEAFDQVWPYLRVLSRSSPEDKHTLVTGLCESELYASDRARQLRIHPDPQVVAVTGDGTNDAPALRRADVGFAMKITGTRVAQDAADILLMDDNFESVVKACMWGRNVYDSIAKFLQFQLTVNISAVTISLVGACAVKQAPLSVVQMLWVNLIMDSLGALALASEQPTEDLLKRKPYGRKKGLISYAMVWNMFGQSFYQLIVLHILLFGAAGEHAPLDDKDPDKFNWQPGGFMDIESGIGRSHHADPTAHYTLIFNCFVFMQLFNWLNCRKLNHEFNVLIGLHKNIMFCVIWILCVIVQVLFIEGAALFSGGGKGKNPGFKTVALGPAQWGLCLGCGAFSMLWYFVIAAAGRAFKPILMPVPPADEDNQFAAVTPVQQTPASDNAEVASRKNARFRKAVYSIIWAKRLTQATQARTANAATLPRSNSKTLSERSNDTGNKSSGSGKSGGSGGASRWSESKRNKADKQKAKQLSNKSMHASRSGEDPSRAGGQEPGKFTTV